MPAQFQRYRIPSVGFHNLYMVVFGTAFIRSIFFCRYLIQSQHRTYKDLYTYKQVIQKERVQKVNLYELSLSPIWCLCLRALFHFHTPSHDHQEPCVVCTEEFQPIDELEVCPCRHAFHRKCLIKWLEVRKVCPLCNMPILPLGAAESPLPGLVNLT